MRPCGVLLKLTLAVAGLLSEIQLCWGGEDSFEVSDVVGARAPAAVLEYLEQHLEQHKEELVEIVSIPSISALPEHASDIERCGKSTIRRLLCPSPHSISTGLFCIC